jgi:predicted ribosome quality control (RQC) complex YloA/Tae2 family protein
MALDGIAVANIVNEMNASLAGARISKIAQPEADEIMLTVKTMAGQRRLLISASASLPLIYFTEKNKLSPMKAPNFCMLLRKHIGSGKIIRVWQPSLERIIHFEIEHYDEMGDLRRKDLVLELMGKHSNLIFCDEKGIIIDSLKHISAQTSSVREVLPGRQYFIALTQDKLDPLSAGREDFLSAVFTKPQPLFKAIYMSFTGISPVIAQEVCCRANLDSDMSAKEIPEDGQLHLARIFLQLMEDVREGSFSPNIIYDAQDIPVEFSSVPLTMYQDMAARQFDSISEVLETYYAQKNASSRIRQKSADLRHLVNTMLERESKKLDLQERQLKDTGKRDKFRLYGELLNTWGYNVPSGASSVTLPNYYDNDTEVKITLDPNKTASENAQRYYEKYEKLKRTFEALNELTEQTRSEVEQLKSIQTFLDQAQSEADLNQIREELVTSGYLKKHDTQKKKGASRPERSRPWHYRTQDGYDIYVGKNNLQNDELTFKSANASDWWFHSKKAPGSHVIARRKDGQDLPDHVFELAASAAAYYSSARDADKVEIDYVQRREVKKPNGSKPGFVIYYTNYSMTARPDISQLTLVE